MLIDAVSSAHFIGKNESEDLICKLLELASVHQEERLHDGVEVDYRVKTENPVIMQITDIINQAIYEKRKISFQYYDVLTETEQRLRNHGEPYVISPYLTHCDEDRYYVVGYREQKGIIQTFRLDRMALSIILDQAAVEPPADFCPEDYGKSVFKMYTGKKESVTLRCSEEVRKNVYDRFGEDIPVIQEEKGCFRTTVAVSVSKTFYTWISNYGGQILILEPLDVKQRYSEFLRRLLAYNEGVATALDK